MYIVIPLCIVNRNIAEGILSQVGALFQQVIHNFQVTLAGCLVQWRAVIDIVSVDIIALTEILTFYST